MNRPALQTKIPTPTSKFISSPTPIITSTPTSTNSPTPTDTPLPTHTPTPILTYTPTFVPTPLPIFEILSSGSTSQNIYCFLGVFILGIFIGFVAINGRANRLREENKYLKEKLKKIK